MPQPPYIQTNSLVHPTSNKGTKVPKVAKCRILSRPAPQGDTHAQSQRSCPSRKKVGENQIYYIKEKNLRRCMGIVQWICFEFSAEKRSFSDSCSRTPWHPVALY